MQKEGQNGRVVRFGVFEADLLARELRKRGVRVRLQEQPFRLLRALLERPGQIVTREEIKDKLWPDDTFVDFDKSLNTAAQKLRQALGDSAESPRFLETVPRQGYRFLAPIEGVVSADSPGRSEDEPSGARQSRRLLVAFSMLAAVAFAILAWQLVVDRQGGSSPWDEMQLRRITYDDGLAMTPSVSADGAFVVFASDRAGNGDLDIWLQQVGSGEPRRLTVDSANESDPAFSPDGRSIVFRSDKDGGGIYLMPALGGEARRLASYGRRPRFSPDGSRIAYFVGSRFKDFDGMIYTVSPAGGEPKNEFPGSWPVWSPSGAHLLFVTRNPDHRGPQWAVGRPDTAEVRTLDEFSRDFHAEMTSVGTLFNNFVVPDSWLESGHVLFSSRHHTSSVWSVRVAPDGTVLRETPEPVTRGGYEREAFASAAGAIAFVSGSYNQDIWSLPIDANAGRLLGVPKRLTDSAAIDESPFLSTSGRLLAFRSYRTGRADSWVKDLETGRLWPITSGPGSVQITLISPDGSRVVYQYYEPGYGYNSEGDKWSTASIDGAEPREICTACDVPFDWSPDGTTIARFGNAFKRGAAQALKDSQGRDLTLISAFGGNPRFSADGKWIASQINLDNDLRQVLVYPVEGLNPETEPVRITDGKTNDFTPDWSPDGRLLYFASERDGFRCVYAQPLDLETKRPHGELIEVFHNHEARVSFGAVANPGVIGVHVEADKIAITMGETRGDIWMLQPRSE